MKYSVFPIASQLQLSSTRSREGFTFWCYAWSAFSTLRTWMWTWLSRWHAWLTQQLWQLTRTLRTWTNCSWTQLRCSTVLLHLQINVRQTEKRERCLTMGYVTKFMIPPRTKQISGTYLQVGGIASSVHLRLWCRHESQWSCRCNLIASFPIKAQKNKSALMLWSTDGSETRSSHINLVAIDRHRCFVDLSENWILDHLKGNDFQMRHMWCSHYPYMSFIPYQATRPNKALQEDLSDV